MAPSPSDRIDADPSLLSILSSRSSVIVAVVIAVAAFAIVGGRAWSLHFSHAQPGNDGWVLMDFRNQIYFPASAFLSGDNPYDTGVYLDKYPASRQFAPYLPSHLLMYSPLAMLPLATAEAAYAVFVACLTMGLALASCRVARFRPGTAAVAALGGLLLVTRPGQMNFLLGQQAAQMALCAYAALSLSRRSPLLAALALAVTMSKPNFGGPIAVLMLVRGDFRAVVLAGAIAGTASLLAAAGLSDAAGGVGPLLSSISANSAAWGRVFLDPASLPPLVDTVSLVSHAMGRTLTPLEQASVAVPILGLSGWALRRLAASEPGHARDALSFNLICIAAITCTYHQAYDCLLLACMAVGLVADTLWLSHRRSDPQARLRWAALFCLCVPVLNFFASHRAVECLQLSGLWLRMPAVVNGLATTALLLIVVRAAYLHSIHHAPGRVA